MNSIKTSLILASALTISACGSSPASAPLDAAPTAVPSQGHIANGLYQVVVTQQSPARPECAGIIDSVLSITLDGENVTVGNLQLHGATDAQGVLRFSLDGPNNTDTGTQSWLFTIEKSGVAGGLQGTIEYTNSAPELSCGFSLEPSAAK